MNTPYNTIIDELLNLLDIDRSMVNADGTVSFNVDALFFINIFENKDKKTIVLLSYLDIDPLFLQDKAYFYRVLLEMNFSCAFTQVSSLALASSMGEADKLCLCCEAPLSNRLNGLELEKKLLLLIEDTETLIKDLTVLRNNFGSNEPDIHLGFLKV